MSWSRKGVLILFGIVLVLGGLVGMVLVLGGLAVGNRQTKASVRERKGVPMNGRVEKSEAAWQAQLTDEQFRVTRKKGTERAFSGAYWNTKDDGIFQCVCCGQPLFDAKTKYNSGTGWPSFWQPIEEDRVSLVEDNGWLGRRMEVVCSRCDAHLGHVFEDGPQPTGLRY